MTRPTGRDVWVSHRTGRGELIELLQGIVAVELVHPSKEFWVVAPWVSNVQVLQDAHGRFRYINPSGGEALSMVSFLSLLQEAGARVTVVTQAPPTPETALFLRSLEAASTGLPDAKNLRMMSRDDLHAKGLLGDTYAISGSMNFTWHGLNKNEELIHFHRDPARVAWLRDSFEDEFGAWRE